MDAETSFIISLLTANAAEQTEYWAKQIPLSVFSLREKEMAWIHNYRLNRGRFPHINTLLRRYDDIEYEDNQEPINVALEPVLQQASFRHIQNVVSNTKTMFDNKEEASRIVESFKSGASSLPSYAINTTDEAMDDARLAFRRYGLTRDALVEGGGRVMSPWPRLNKLIQGNYPGEVVGITARTNMGKSWAIVAWADYLASLGIKVLIISKEMPTPQIVDRVTAVRYRKHYGRLRARELDIDELLDWKAQLLIDGREYPLYVTGEETMEGIGIEQVYAKIQQYKPRVVFLDGAYLLTISGLSKNASERETFAALSRACKRLAKATNVTLFPVLQNNRTAENKDGSTGGNIASVYGSDAWAQDADVLIEMAGNRDSNERIMRVHKSRESALGEFYIDFKFEPYPSFKDKAALTSTKNKNKFTILA